MTTFLDGQTAIVTGASRGIGRAIAETLARAGAAVVIDYHASAEEADEVVRGISREKGRVVAVQADTAKEDDVERLFDAARDAFGSIDIVVPNAGIQRDAAVAEMSLEDWNAVIGVNLTGQWLCCREAVRRFRAQGPRPDVSRALGKIVCISSVHEFIPWAGHVNYAASKGGLMLMMKSLAQEVAAERIRVNSVAPGAIATDINRQVWETPQGRERLLKLIPYGRIGEPEDVAKAVAWLVSDESDYVTGATLVVDGGMGLYPGFVDNG